MPSKRKKLRTRKELDREFEAILQLASKLAKARRHRIPSRPLKKRPLPVSLAARA